MTEIDGSTINEKLVGYFNASGVTDNHALQDGLSERDDLTLMMGQTFDDGQPLDLLKYGLLIDGIQGVAEQSGIRSTANWLIADHFISDINKDEVVETVTAQAQDRVDYLERLNWAFGLNIGHVMSSQLAETTEYKSNVAILDEESETNPAFRDALFLAVPEDRRDDPLSIRYPIEEIATIASLGTDIKVGPVYERKYDDPTRNIASKIGFKVFSSVYATKGFLFGSPAVSDDVAASIEAFGILPYKIDSKGQRSHRIDPINDQPDEVEKLIFDTNDPRAITDLLAIAVLASKKLQTEQSNVVDAAISITDIKQLKKLAYNAYLCYIYSPLYGVVN